MNRQNASMVSAYLFRNEGRRPKYILIYGYDFGVLKIGNYLREAANEC